MISFKSIILFIISIWYFIIYFDLFTLILISNFSYGFVTLFIIQWSSLYTLKHPVIMLGPYILKKLTIFKCCCIYSNILALVLSILHLVVFLNTYIFSILYSTFFYFKESYDLNEIQINHVVFFHLLFFALHIFL